MMFEICGVMGMMLTTICGLPQVYKTLKTKSVEDLSLTFYVILSMGITLGLIYSVSIGVWIYVIGGTLSLLVSVILIIFILKYKKKL